MLPHLPNMSNIQLCTLFEKIFKNKNVRINDIICASTTVYTYILNTTIYIYNPIDSLSIFTIPSLYEVNEILMKSHNTFPIDPLPISLYHKLSILFFTIFFGYSNSNHYIIQLIICVLFYLQRIIII